MKGNYGNNQHNGCTGNISVHSLHVCSSIKFLTWSSIHSMAFFAESANMTIREMCQGSERCGVRLTREGLSTFLPAHYTLPWSL